jgi:Ser/Thr protein kinase RdoA (MazF antagonist)
MTPDLKPLIDALRAHVVDLEQHLGALGYLPSLVVHGDYYAENLILDGKDVVGVVDYDQAHRCARVIELAEALIYFAREPGQRFQHIVYSNLLNLDAAHMFVNAYGERVRLSQTEATALPHFIRTVWLCASLAPPLGPEMDAQRAIQALPEVLTLANWAKENAPSISLLVLGSQACDTAFNSIPTTIVRKS